MSVATHQHPPKAVLTAFSTGSLKEPVASEVTDHLLECDACTHKLLELQSEDTLLDLLKQQEVPVDCRTTASRAISAPSGGIKELELLSDHPRYELLELIGRGGLGNVFRARHRLMDREVAIKFLNAPRWRKRLQQGEAVLRFQREVKQQGPLLIKDALECLRQVCLGLEVAHRQGMVHRDIKPHKLMVSRGDQRQLHVTILDFGIASLGDDRGCTVTVSPNSGLTQTGRSVGTPEYISPEQAMGTSSIDCRADIDSLGATLYFLLMGRPLFFGTSEELLKSTCKPYLRSAMPCPIIQSLHRCCRRCLRSRQTIASSPLQSSEIHSTSFKINLPFPFVLRPPILSTGRQS